MLREKYALNRRARVLGQSNGGLIAYAWAFRHPDCVDRIGGICPATDFRTWPTLPNVVAFPERGLGYDLTHERLAARHCAIRIRGFLRACGRAGELAQTVRVGD